MKLHFIGRKLFGTVEVPGDKSISHRAAMLGAIATGKTIIHGFLQSEDCIGTLRCLRQLGVEIEQGDHEVIIHGKGWDGLRTPCTILDVGNSGTTIRLMMGLVAGTRFATSLTGDSSIAKRPMDRVVAPLRQMGAEIKGLQDGKYVPITIQGSELTAISYTTPVASAQVKSAILLAGLQANGLTKIVEDAQTRDHTERMITQFGGTISQSDHEISLIGKQQLTGQALKVPGDISSAVYWLVAAAITPNSELTIKNVGLNPTRTGIIDVLRQMNAQIDVQLSAGHGEPIGDITIRSSELRSTTIEGNMIPRLIDELPVIALLATQAEGVTIIRDAAEMRVKESDRIAVTVEMLQVLGADITATNDGFIIRGKKPLNGGQVSSMNDHRIGMMLAVASLITAEPVHLQHGDAVSISYPSFFADFASILV